MVLWIPARAALRETGDVKPFTGVIEFLDSMNYRSCREPVDVRNT